MKYIIKNIKSFIRTEKMIFLLVLLCIITSSFIINFSYGLYQNYHVIKEEESSELDEIIIIVNDSNLVTKDKIKECVFSIPDKTNEVIDMYLVYPKFEPFSNMLDWGPLMVRFRTEKGIIKPCEVFHNALVKNGNLKSGEYFSEDQEMNGELVAIARIINEDDLDFDCTNNIISRIEGDDYWIEIQGKEFKVIGWHSQLQTPYIPFESLEESTEFENVIWLTFTKPITRPQYNDVRESFENIFGSAITVPDLDIPESESYYLYNTIILISIIIAVLAAINFAVLYKYILSKRMKMLAVFRICGCTKSKALAMFLSECMIITVPLFAATTLIYDKFVLPKLGQHFEYIESAYSIKLYLLIFGIYIAATLVVLLFMINGFLKKTIREAKEEK